MNGRLRIHFSRQPQFLLVLSFNLASKEGRRSEHEVMRLWFPSYYNALHIIYCRLALTSCEPLFEGVSPVLKYHRSRNPSFSRITSTIICTVLSSLVYTLDRLPASIAVLCWRNIGLEMTLASEWWIWMIWSECALFCSATRSDQVQVKKILQKIRSGKRSG
jgi:hypothetical protein